MENLKLKKRIFEIHLMDLTAEEEYMNLKIEQQKFSLVTKRGKKLRKRIACQML